MTKPKKPSEAPPGFTVSGPSDGSTPPTNDDNAAKMDGTNSLAAAIEHNANKPLEYGFDEALTPQQGEAFTPDDPIVGASTVTEVHDSEKVGGGGSTIGRNRTVRPLDGFRADGSGQRLTTNQGVPVSDNQHSLKAGLRGPTLLEDFVLREKLTHFDHERIPERIVHARGSAAHGYFECYEPLNSYTRASLFSTAGKRTPVFVRFSTVLGERGSTDTARDARGFAVKFYTDEGNWDLVGNNIPVFFIQDAMKFPDLVHAAKPEPHFGMPQATAAHDTFWDFASLMPETTAMLMWVMSDRGIPRSYRMMQGFGVHTFRLVNAEGESHFVKFHWTPTAGTHALTWDEAVKISGADPDYHRRDLWEAIEGGEFPEYELGFQIFTEEQAEEFSFDILDATKIIPEELVPLTPVGKLVLNRNPDNFFAETEQVAFCTAHIVPGIDFSNDPLLAGRIHSYVDTQISRLGGPNFHEIPINAPVAQVHNNQRDGMHRQAIHRGRVAYEPNSLGGGCPFQAGQAGFVSHAPPTEPEPSKVRGNPEKFADHYTQARLFFDSQTPMEKAHIANAFTFELSRVQVPAIRIRMVAGLLNVDQMLAESVAEGLGISPLPDPLPKAIKVEVEPEVMVSPALSMTARPGHGRIAARRVAILVADGVVAKGVHEIAARLRDEGAVPRILSGRLGEIGTSNGETLEADGTIASMPAVLFDAAVVAGGADSVKVLIAEGRAREFVRDQYRHLKPLLVLGDGADLLEAAGVPLTLVTGGADPGLIVVKDRKDDSASLDRFIEALSKHRVFERETDPPVV